MADGSGVPGLYVVTEAIKYKLDDEGRIQYLHVTLKVKNEEN